jgi:hypothetical protein
MVPDRKGTCLVNATIRHSGSRIEVRADDPTLTGQAGMLAAATLIERLEVVEAIDDAVGPIKERDRGLSAGEFVTSLAECLIGGGDFLSDLDHARADQAGAFLRAVTPPPSTTANSLARRFGDEQIAALQRANAQIVQRGFAGLPRGERRRLHTERPTVDVDSTEIEIYGAAKRASAYNYLGQRAVRALPATWANLGVTLAADLFAGNIDPRSRAIPVIQQALSCLPAGLRRPIVRLDSGFFALPVINTIRDCGADWAVAVPRNRAVWRAIRAVKRGSWRPALDLPGAEIAELDYQPSGWPPCRAMVRRVRYRPDQISTNPRARRRRTIDPDQLALFDTGKHGALYGYSIICTSLRGRPERIEHWFRQRTQIEDRIRDTKLGYALRHLPSGHPHVNHTWAWAAHLALNLTVLLQAIAYPNDQRAHAKRLRRELLCIPGRLTTHARSYTLHLPTGYEHIIDGLRRLDRLRPAA